MRTNKEIVNIIDSELKKKKIHRKIMCSQIGVSKDTLDKWARKLGQNMNMKIHSIYKIAEYLNLSLDYLLNENVSVNNPDVYKKSNI